MVASALNSTRLMPTTRIILHLLQQPSEKLYDLISSRLNAYWQLSFGNGMEPPGNYSWLEIIHIFIHERNYLMKYTYLSEDLSSAKNQQFYVVCGNMKFTDFYSTCLRHQRGIEPWNFKLYEWLLPTKNIFNVIKS